MNVGKELETENRTTWKRKGRDRSEKIMYAIIHEKWLIHI